jgi:hypothetical protein
MGNVGLKEDYSEFVMKVILSRKGFDSKNGGYPSPILTDLRLVSLPIPWKSDEHKYSDLHLDSSRTYYDLMRDLKIRIKYNKKRDKLTEDTRCHLDPDINLDVIERKLGWKGIFGQMDKAQSHLKNKGVKNGDLFLFFGWFKRTAKEEKTFDSSSPDLHIIFGYLQIDKIIRDNFDTDICEWMKYHPHANKERKENPTNTIYVARDRLTWNNGIPGYGIFRFNEALVLTKEGYSRSKWNLPSFFKNVEISYHSPSAWKPEGHFQSAKIGQEFVVEDNPLVEEWAKKLIEENRT